MPNTIGGHPLYVCVMLKNVKQSNTSCVCEPSTNCRREHTTPPGRHMHMQLSFIKGDRVTYSMMSVIAENSPYSDTMQK